MKFICSIFAALMMISPAHANLGDRVALKKDIAATGTDATKAFKTACGFDVPVSVDEASFTKEQPKFKAKNINSVGQCANAAAGASDLCSDADAKPELQKAVKKIVCMAGEPANKFQFDLKSGTLTVTYGAESPYLRDKAKSWLMDNL